jgi:hypothetical protein
MNLGIAVKNISAGAFFSLCAKYSIDLSPPQRTADVECFTLWG